MPPTSEPTQPLPFVPCVPYEKQEDIRVHMDHPINYSEIDPEYHQIATSYPGCEDTWNLGKGWIV